MDPRPVPPLGHASVKPVGLSLPEDFRAILAVAPEVRTDAQKTALAVYFRAIDLDLRPGPMLSTRARRHFPSTRNSMSCEAGSSSPRSRSGLTPRCWSCAVTWR